jgi:hypothetical protein
MFGRSYDAGKTGATSLSLFELPAAATISTLG